jgi:hypothetical protein
MHTCTHTCASSATYETTSLKTWSFSLPAALQKRDMNVLQKRARLFIKHSYLCACQYMHLCVCVSPPWHDRDMQASKISKRITKFILIHKLRVTWMENIKHMYCVCVNACMCVLCISSIRKWGLNTCTSKQSKIGKEKGGHNSSVSMSLYTYIL